MLKTFFFFSLFLNMAFAQDFKAEALKSWKNRDDQKSMEDALAKFEKAPQNLETLTYLARGHFLYAEYFVSGDEKKMDAYEKAKKFGDKALELNPVYKKFADDDITTAIEQLNEKEVAPLYWRACALGKWARLNGIMKSLKYKDEIQKSIKQVEKLKPDFFHGAVPRYWGSYYAIAPGIAGGDMDKSKENFKKSMSIAPEYLGTKTLYAEHYLVKEDKEKEFKEVLNEVISSGDGPEDIAPENRLEKKRAKHLLDKVKKLF